MNQNIIHAWNNWVNEKEKIGCCIFAGSGSVKGVELFVFTVCLLYTCLVVHSKWMKIKLPEKHLMIITMDGK